MKHFKFIVLTCILAGILSGKSQILDKSQENEKIIKGYFAGWEKKDWSLISRLLADDFTFTSPANDDHIPTEKFKAKCWPQAEYIQKFEFIKIIGNDHEAFAIIHVLTKTNKIIRNTEYFNFSNGKIKSIEVFFGGSGSGFPTNAK